MDYCQSLEYLEELYGMIGYDLSLVRIQALMEDMGNPQDSMNFIHVAGTNGKGSICSMVSSVLMEAGFKVGMYTSPHLEKYNERITIDENQITDLEFAEYISDIKSRCEKIVKKGVGQPTVFEVVTAAAFKYFYDKGVDYVVLEVGMGGRCDATNIIKNPKAAVIASISMDHMDYLGDTIEKIAYEKGGIIKENCPTILLTENKDVYNVIKSICNAKNSKLYFSNKTGAIVKKQDVTGTVFDIDNGVVSYKDVKIGLIGEYQLMNAAEVLMTFKAMGDNDLKIDEETVKNGLEKAKWSGRMEIVEKNPMVVLDGAHNIDGISMLSKSIKKYFSGKNITMLIGILGDKEYEKMLELIMPCVSKAVFTEPHSDRRWHVDELNSLISKYGIEAFVEKDIEKAYNLAKKITDKNDVVVCAGSLYLIGELYKLARKSEGGII